MRDTVSIAEFGKIRDSSSISVTIGKRLTRRRRAGRLDLLRTVPEPAACAMMVADFGLIGGTPPMIRGRRVSAGECPRAESEKDGAGTGTSMPAITP